MAKDPVNPLPAEIPAVSEKDHKMLELYLQEWKVVIETQMHFNDLILRFRSIILTVFVTLIGTTIATKNFLSLSKSDLPWIIAIPGTLWLTAFVIDYFYYHRLLLGSVAQASKFDDPERLKRYGLFGMTTCINKHLKPRTSKKLVCLYYFIPFAAMMVFVLWRFL